jgi:allantoicase
MATGHEFINLADLASARVGGRAIATNDDFFASKANLVKPESAVFIPDKYTPRGKWMDGWESRRRRVPGHDWCIVQLGMRGIVHGVNVDTSHFTGNYPSHCSIEAVDLPAGIKPASYAVEGPPWTPLLQKTALRGNGENLFQIGDRRPWTHLRLSIYPDGGVARLRVYGEVSVDWDRVAPKGKTVDLASVKLGGLFLTASDTHYGTRGALIMPDRAKNMGDGWETKRSRDLNHTDWAIVRLGAPGMVSKIEIDTNHYKGNYPDRASVEGVMAPNVIAGNLAGMTWSTILPETKLSANKRHFYSGKQIHSTGPFSHVRLNIFPDGGVSRLRVHGAPVSDEL